jgi:DNA-directed RNA polymerase sigma subunit (sigma70/sigma32)
MLSTVYAGVPPREQKRETPELLAGYLDRIGKWGLLTRQEEIALSRRVRQGDERARKKLIEWNLKLVVSVAKRYREMGVPFEDLIQEVDHSQIVQLETLRRGIWGTKSLWGRVLTYKG